MPTSEARLSPQRDDVGYAEALAAFRARHVAGEGREAVVSAFHAVRNLPYFSGPDRSALAALRTGQGACTAKHVLLRDLLRGLGVPAVVEIVEGDFASSIPLSETMPETLATMIREGGVRDFHCRVRIGAGLRAQRLDATWPDALEAWGFVVNRGWDGAGDTRPAIEDVAIRSDAEDVLVEKARLLAGLTAEEADRRGTFLRLLSDWLQGRS